MRIIAGQYRGSKLVSPDDGRIRPTSDRVRESLFSILGNVHGKRVLDLFAGTGALGIEALSRGATHATFVDTSNDALTIIRKNLERVDEDVRVVASKVPKVFGQLDGTYDLVFLDPPYETDLIVAALDGLVPLIDVNTTIVCETAKSIDIELPDGFALTDERIYGKTKLLFVALS